MTIYVPGKVTLRQTWQPMDPDAATYITAVEAADGQALEEKVKIAIDNFVIGCKADGIWSAIKASCILAGARTLDGALVPLVGTAPTNYNFVSGDYNRETGLVGDGSTKYLDSNRNNNADPQNSKHCAVSLTVANSENVAAYMGAGGSSSNAMFVGRGSVSLIVRLNSNAVNLTGSPTATGFYAANRAEQSSITARVSGETQIISITSETPTADSIFVFNRTAGDVFANARIAFYSIGESLDLALLDARVTDLINAIGAAIP